MIDSPVNLSDHLPIIIELIIDDHVTKSKPENVPNNAYPVNQIRWDKADLPYYFQETGNKLVPILESLRQPYNKIVDSFTIFNSGFICRDDFADDYANARSKYKLLFDESVALIDNHYAQLVGALAETSICLIQTCKPNVQKHWWSEELSQLKHDSIDSHSLWCSSGKPKSGPIYDIFKNAKYAYKLCIRRSKSDAEVTITNELHDALCSKDSNNFWKI